MLLAVSLMMSVGVGEAQDLCRRKAIVRSLFCPVSWEEAEGLASRFSSASHPQYDFFHLQSSSSARHYTQGKMPSNHHDSESTPLLQHIVPQHIHPDGESGRSGFQASHFIQVAWRSGSNAAKWTNLLWPIVPVAIIMHFVFPSNPITVFALSYIAMIPVANLLGFAGQEYARKMPKVSGILIETAFGSIVEIILFIILIVKHTASEGSSEHGNLIPVIQAAILGSILTNLLLCLGLCFFVGGLRQARQKFHASISEVGSGLLLVAGFGLLIPSAYFSALKGSAVQKATKHHEFTEKILQHNVLKISQVTSILLMIAFAM
jgi:Ca2+:H+ antiporter